MVLSSWWGVCGTRPSPGWKNLGGGAVEGLDDSLLPVWGGWWEAVHYRQPVNSIDGFLTVGRRAGLGRGRVTSCPGLPRTEEFPGTQGMQTRVSWLPE